MPAPPLLPGLCRIVPVQVVVRFDLVPGTMQVTAGADEDTWTN